MTNASFRRLLVHGKLLAKSFINSCTAKHLCEKSGLCLLQCHQEDLVLPLPPHVCQPLHGQCRVLNRICAKKAFESKARWQQTKYRSIRCTWRLQLIHSTLFHARLKCTCANRPTKLLAPMVFEKQASMLYRQIETKAQTLFQLLGFHVVDTSRNLKTN